MSFSTPNNPFSEQPARKPSLELSRFSAAFQQWDLTSGEASPHRGSHPDSDYSSSSQNSTSNADLEVLGPPHATRQRTTLACDKCRDRKTKCSGEHPICKRCTARGLICHYSERDRIRGPTKARLRNAMSSSSLDLRFEADSRAATSGQEDFAQSPTYSMEYVPSPQSQYQHFSFPLQPRFPYSQPCSQAGSPALDHRKLSNMSPPQPQQNAHRRVQSQSALGAIYRHHLPLDFRPAGGASSHFGRSSVVEFDMRSANGAHYQDDGASSSSEPRSASTSVFSPDLMSRSSKSSDSTFPEPLSRSASELDLRMMNQLAQYRHQRLCSSEDAGKMPCPEYGLHSPLAVLASFNGLSLGRPARDISVPPVNETFENPWRDEKLVMVRDVELMYPTPVTPIALGSDAIDRMVGGGYSYDHMVDQGPPAGYRQ